MLNKFEFVTSSPNKSFDSYMKQNVGQLLTVNSVLLTETYQVIRKRGLLRNMEPSESGKMTILKNLQNSREFSREF